MQRDPIEQTKEYKAALKIIQPELDDFEKQLDAQGMRLGSCHIYWSKKKQLLKSMGIDWQSPSECNPYIKFD